VVSVSDIGAASEEDNYASIKLLSAGAYRFAAQ